MLLQVATADDPINFLDSPEVESSVREMLKKAKSRKLIWREIRIILAYLAAHLIFFNGQRPGIVQKMTISEFKAKSEEDGEYVIYVKEHKTTGSFGPARVVVSTKICNLMEIYFNDVRKGLAPQHEVYKDRFFLTNTGNEYAKVSERIRDVAESFGVPVPKLGLERKVVATETFKSEKNDSVVRKIQKHMCHSTATCEAFYQQTDNSVAVSSKRTIEQIMMARHFTQEESSVVTKEYPLNEEATPSLGICDQIVQKHKLNKTKKQVQDHWRSLKKHVT